MSRNSLKGPSPLKVGGNGFLYNRICRPFEYEALQTGVLPLESFHPLGACWQFSGRLPDSGHKKPEGDTRMRNKEEG